MSQRSLSARTVRVLAPAKINLTLHVTGRRDDGYHLLDSLVVFADVGDDLRVRIDDGEPLTVDGPEAALVPTDPTNLVLRAAGLFTDLPGASFVLTKTLPVASGIGGGSADAAAAVRALLALRSEEIGATSLSDPRMAGMARDLLALGADIPVCLMSQGARMSGIGEHLQPLSGLPDLHAVLVNPRLGVSTPAVFRALRQRDNPPMPEVPQGPDLDRLIGWLRAQRNDLEPPAMALLPEIGRVRAALESQAGCLLARMSGSGATCFGLFETRSDADDAARSIAGRQPDWWVRSARLGDQGQAAQPRIA